MTFDIIVGIILTAVSLCVIVFLVLWSRHIIERIHSKPPRTLREIKQEIDSDQPQA